VGRRSAGHRDVRETPRRRTPLPDAVGSAGDARCRRGGSE
jgi:hypothetical protein